MADVISTGAIASCGVRRAYSNQVDTDKWLENNFNGSRYRKEIAPAIAEFILTQEMVAAVDRRSQPRLRKVVG